eukprot:TRINITY_DN8050_c0_g1_i5.p1 TRINITY_DN8050_c0_g1~~TRINITY_DN8050_c0_g1_i5.p1  ORF type:complete len:671 (+),score=67.20 TRINITY_DN8050_c0_g1_i5:226-2238(+)
MSSLRSRVNKVLDIDFNSDDVREFLIFVNDHVETSDLSEQTTSEKIQSAYLDSCQKIIDHYAPTYNAVKQIVASADQVYKASTLISEYILDIQERNQFLLNKLRRFSQKEHELTFKIDFLSSLVQHSSLEPAQLNMLIDDQVAVENAFFDAYDRMRRIGDLQKCLDQVDYEDRALKTSLQRNVAEIENLALAKLSRHVIKNINELDAVFLGKSRSILEGNPEHLQSFEKNLLKNRKNAIALKIHSSYQNARTKEAGSEEKAFAQLLTEFMALVKNEISFMKSVHSSRTEQSRIEYILKIFEPGYKDLTANLDSMLQESLDFFGVFQIMMTLEYYERDMLSTITGEDMMIKDEKLLEEFIGTFIKPLEKFDEKCLTLFKKTLKGFEYKLMNISISLDNPSSYLRVTELINKLHMITRLKFDKNLIGKEEDLLVNNQVKTFINMINVEDLLKVVINTINYHLNANERSLKSLIFSLNVITNFYNLLEQSREIHAEIAEAAGKVRNICNDLSQLVIRNGCEQVFHETEISELPNPANINPNIQYAPATKDFAFKFCKASTKLNLSMKNLLKDYIDYINEVDYRQGCYKMICEALVNRYAEFYRVISVLIKSLYGIETPTTEHFNRMLVEVKITVHQVQIDLRSPDELKTELYSLLGQNIFCMCLEFCFAKFEA